MTRAAALTLLILSFMVGQAQAMQTFHVYVGDNPLAQARNGAVGLLVPGAGPETSRELALASLVRGQVENSLRGGIPPGPVRIRVSTGEPQTSAPRIIVSLPRGGLQQNDSRYLVVVVGPGYHGLLVSDSTRIPGLVSIADIAPTALGEPGALRSQPDADPLATLDALGTRIDRHNEVGLAARLTAAVVVLILAAVAPMSALLAYAAILAANLLLGATGTPATWVVVLVIAIAGAAGGPLLARAFRSNLAIGLVLAGVLAAYALALGLRGEWVALSPFNPTGNERFYGIGNLLETMLLVPALAAATLLRRRLGWLAFAAVALLAFVTVAGNRFGADGGGAIVFGVGFAVLAGLLGGLRGRRLLATIAGALAVVVALLALDAATGSASTHVSRALDGGPAGLAADLRDRIVLSWRWIERSRTATVLVALSVPALVALVVRRLRSGTALALAAPPLALAAAIGASLLVNDSPKDVATAGLIGYVVMEAVMLRGQCAPFWPSFRSSPGSRSSLPAAAQRQK
jgi:hypothetical protein